MDGAADRAAWHAAVIAILVLTLARVAAIAVSPLDLYTDESQYWLWGQHPAFGYYSKPPLIGWLIGAVTAILGDHAWTVRLPAPLLHAGTAVLTGLAAGRIDPRLAPPAALAYATLPMTAAGSFLISTDTVMLPFLMGALLLWLPRPQSAGRAFAAGLLVGIGLLAKYAAIYAVGGVLVAALLSPALRPSARAGAAAGAGVLLGAAPNILWNLASGFVTFRHTAENAGAMDGRVDLSLAGPLRFLAEQLGVLGPILFPALLVAGIATLLRPAASWRTLLAALALLPVIVVSLQATTSDANANWAVAGYGAGTILAVVRLGPLARRMSLALNGTLSAALIAVTAMPPLLPEDLRERVFARYEGRGAVAQGMLAAAKEAGLGTVVAEERGLLADLFWFGRGSPVAVRAVPADGPPPHHYAMAFPLEGGKGEVLLAAAGVPDCGRPFRTLEPRDGAYGGKVIHLSRVPRSCLAP